MSQKIHSDTNKHSRGPAASIDILFEKKFAGNSVCDQRKRSRGRSGEAQIEMIQREEQREEGQREKADTGKEERAGEDGADCALQAGVGTNVI